ncbi:DUF3035 domain-containing protein [Antarcticimicrobium luteum]|uniref:DUF3035 domain-containing protein n=1 Tax=Antarcticimicrobium luteum TaxID=2547397 RepID=A0A4R5V345_9RHOB|nr:DUF3035 domain-containing protein [Antarcticimicrobium luteum]TDK46262.1 DUF3035 domain-containing protein [Antarcticimicrobium luteum]
MLRPLGITIMLVTAVSVAGCSSKGLRNLSAPGPGPDEFMILPVKPLTAPTDYSALPAPDPGAANLVDPTPMADAVVAMGGRAEATVPGGVPAADSALISAATRHGVESGVRDTLAEADAKFRKRQSRMTRVRLLPVDRYEQAYRRQALEPFPTNELYRRAGAGTPTAPPAKP